MPKPADLRALGEFAASRHSVFARSEAADLGISRHVLRRLVRDGIVVAVTPVVYRFTNAEVTWQQTLYSTVVGTAAVASHASAAALHELDGQACPQRVLHILCGAPLSLRRAGVRVHRTRTLPEDDFLTIASIPCTTMARTICDLAGDPDVTTDP